MLSFILCPGIFSYKREELEGPGLLCLARTGNPKSLLNTACGNKNCSSVLESNLETSMTVNNDHHLGTVVDSDRPAFGVWLL